MAPNRPAGGFVQCRINMVWITEIFPANESSRYCENFQPDVISLRAVDRTGNLSEPAIWMPKK